MAQSSNDNGLTLPVGELVGGERLLHDQPCSLSLSKIGSNTPDNLTTAFMWVTGLCPNDDDCHTGQTSYTNVLMLNQCVKLPIDSPVVAAVMIVREGIVCPLHSVYFKVLGNTKQSDSTTTNIHTVAISATYELILSVPSDKVVDDMTESTKQKALAHETELQRAFALFFQNKFVDRPHTVEPTVLQLMHLSSVDVDMPDKIHLPITNGIAHIQDGLSAWSDIETYTAFTQCLQFADKVTGYNADSKLSVDEEERVAEMRFVSALRMFAGPKHQQPEKIDDRTLLTTKLYSTGDCDDAAIMMCALATRLKAIHQKGRLNTLFEHAAPDVKQIVKIIGSVQDVQYHQGTTFTQQGGCGPGHAWASLVRTNPITKQTTRLHCEGLRLMSCHIGDLQYNYGNHTFTQRTTNNDPNHARFLGIEEIPDQCYNEVCATYTSTCMLVPVLNRKVGVQFSDYMCMNNCVIHNEFVPNITVDKNLQDLMRLRAKPAPKSIKRASNRLQTYLYPGLTKVNIEDLSRPSSRAANSEQYSFVSVGNVYYS